jgi:hypothetical protein
MELCLKLSKYSNKLDSVISDLHFTTINSFYRWHLRYPIILLHSSCPLTYLNMVYGVRPQRQCNTCGIGEEISFKTTSVHLPCDEINTSGHSWFPGDFCNYQYFLVNQRHLSQFPCTTDLVLKQKRCHFSGVLIAA